MKPALFLLTLAPALALGQGTMALKAQLQKDYTAMSVAFRRNQPGVFETYLAKSYYLVQPQGGKWNRDRVMSDFKKQMTSMKQASWQRNITDLKVSGNTATVTIDGTFTGMFTMGADKKLHQFFLKSRSVDVWQIKPQHKLLSSNIKKLDPKIDGKTPQMGGH